MSIGIYLGVVGLNWLILFREYKIIKKRLLEEGYAFNVNKRISNESLICFIQLMTNTIIPGINIINILNIIFMKNDIYNLAKTILLLADMIEYDNKEIESNINNIKIKTKTEEKTKEITRMDKIKQLKDEKNKLLGNSNEKNYVLTKHHQSR